MLIQWEISWKIQEEHQVTLHFNRSHSENLIWALKRKFDETSKKLDFLIRAKEKHLTVPSKQEQKGERLLSIV